MTNQPTPVAPPRTAAAPALQDRPGIYVACLAAYNSGVLHGRWIAATTPDEIQAEVTAMLAESPVPGAEEWAIHDHEGFEGIALSECAAFETVCDLAAFLTEQGSLGAKLHRHFGGRLEEARAAFEDYAGQYRTAADFAEEVILHVLYAEEDKSLAGCARFLSDPGRTFAATLGLMMSTPHLRAHPHPVVAQAARELQNKSENERSGVLSTALSFLSLYRDPVVAEVTSRSDWRIADLVHGLRPMSLYLACPPSDVSRTKPLMRLVLNQIARRLTEQVPDPSRRKLLLMLDEFPALGRIDFFETALAFMAGYGVRAFLVAQSLNQIEKVYGPNNAILDNCHVRVAFATNDERTARRISEALGTKTEQRSQKNYTGHRLAPWLSHMMVSRQETQRALMTPGEIMQLPATDEIVMVSGLPPVRARKLRYFEDRNFTRRVLPPASMDRAGGGQPHDWVSVCLVEPDCPGGDKGADSGGGGGPDLEPELDPVRQDLPEVDMAGCTQSVDEDSLNEEDPQAKTIRRAAAIDKGGSDFLPDF